jgi:hypothetical protein
MIYRIRPLPDRFAVKLSILPDRSSLQFLPSLESSELSAQLDFLRTRSLILDVAVVLATVGGVATCAAALVLFLGELRDADVKALLFGLFGPLVARGATKSGSTRTEKSRRRAAP